MLCCDPLDPPPVARQAGLALERRICEVDGQKIAAELHLLPASSADAPPPIVFLHGVLTSSCLATELFADPSRFSWISLSLPGHAGGSFAPGIRGAEIDAAFYVRLIEGALQHLVGSQRVILVGWSLGGFTVLAVTAAHPERVAAVACLAGFAEPRFTGIVRVMSWMVRLPGAASLVEWGLWLAGLMPRVFWFVALLTASNWRAFRAADAKAVLYDVWLRYRCHDPASLALVLATLPKLNVGDAVAGITCPALIGSGSHDPVVPVEEARRIAGRLHQAELRIYDGAGHMFFCEWAGFQEHLAAWLQLHFKGFEA
jgi:pimeloyl-ACP methyl ester carboxylesterase